MIYYEKNAADCAFGYNANNFRGRQSSVLLRKRLDAPCSMVINTLFIVAQEKGNPHSFLLAQEQSPAVRIREFQRWK